MVPWLKNKKNVSTRARIRQIVDEWTSMLGVTRAVCA